MTFEEKAGVVPVTVHEAQGRITGCELAAPQALSFGKTIPPHLAASAVAIATADIVTDTHQPQVASVGLPFLMVELRDRSGLERCHVNISGFEALRAEGIWPSVVLYTRARDGFDIRARMFAPLSGVPEDPATGSASCALGGLVAHYGSQPTGSVRLRIAQGVEMGRPSTLLARAEKVAGAVRGTWVGGACALVSEGFLWLD